MNITIDLLHPLVMLFTGGAVGIIAYKWLNRDVYFDPGDNGLFAFIFVVLVLGGLTAAILYLITGGA